MIQPIREDGFDPSVNSDGWHLSPPQGKMPRPYVAYPNGVPVPGIAIMAHISAMRAEIKRLRGWD